MTSTRREFLHGAAMRLGAAAIGGRLLRSPEQVAASRSIERLGIQLYTLRSRMQESVESTLARVAAIGYAEVEFAGYFDRTPAQVATMLKANGLRAPSAHITLDQIRNSWPRTLDVAGTIGHAYLVCAFIDAKERTADSYNRIADEFNRAGEQARAHGIRFAYHNHDFEFAAVGSTLPYDMLLAQCDADLVQMELDLYWINKARRDPLDYFARYPGRFPLVHVKDMASSGAMADAGAGSLPFGRYFAQATTAGIRHYFVERDDPVDPFQSAERSFRYLKSLEF
ncbi:MAG: Inosose dehydratase [Gemmatimonadaceae bacterium]|nr:Inosose dehydratase [Gemmatimonadaceae bacterium]